MATYYVWSGATGSNTGADWTNAYTDVASAFTAATSTGDIIKIHYTYQESKGSSNPTYTCGADSIRFISVDKDNSDAPTAMGTSGWLGDGTRDCSVSFVYANYKFYMWGITTRSGFAGLSDYTYFNSNQQDGHCECENCFFWYENTSGGGIRVGASSTSGQNYFLAKDCTIKFASNQQGIGFDTGICELENFTIDSGGNSVNYVFDNSTAQSTVICNGCDFSHSSGLVPDLQSGTANIHLINCKLPSGTMYQTQTNTNKSSPRLSIRNSSTGDNHYVFEHYDSLGSLVTQTSVYVTSGGALYDGTNPCAWKIDTTANCTFYQPFRTPWIELYWNSATSIQPYIEIMRDGSTTAWKDDEVWLEIEYQATSGSTKSTITDDRCTLANHLAGSASNQASSSLTSSDWTGGTASDWFGKLQLPSTISAAEIGTIRARVCVAVNTSTTPLYIDPQIRY